MHCLLNVSRADFMVYTRGSDDEYNRWANLTGDEGWAWKNVKPFYFKVSSRFEHTNAELTRIYRTRGSFPPLTEQTSLANSSPPTTAMGQSKSAFRASPVFSITVL